MKKDFNSFEEFARYCESYHPGRDYPEAAWAAKVAAGWRCHCAKVGKPADLGERPRAYTPAELERTEEEAAFWRQQARQKAEAAQNFAVGTPLATLAADWLRLHGRRHDGRLLN